MKRPTEIQAARIEARIERLRIDASHENRPQRHLALHAEADRLEAEYWDACGLADDTRRQLEASRGRVWKGAVA
jgi:hypothetical protein